MKHANELMSDPEVQKNKIGTDIKRSERNEWGNEVEEAIRSNAPFPITYDVNCLQGMNFSEYSYTELVGGMYIRTQSTEANTRLIHAASQQESDISVIDKWAEKICDKYELEELPKNFRQVNNVIFIPGDNMSDLVNRDNLHRLLHENPEAMIKPHPLTNDGYYTHLCREYGADRILNPKLSGINLLKNAENIFTTSASELGIIATVLGKNTINIGMFRYEAIGTYYAITRALFLSDNPKQTLANIVNCVWSGCIMPWQENLEERIQSFYQSTLEIRDEFKDLNSPILIPDSIKRHQKQREEQKRKLEENK